MKNTMIRSAKRLATTVTALMMVCMLSISLVGSSCKGDGNASSNREVILGSKEVEGSLLNKIEKELAKEEVQNNPEKKAKFEALKEKLEAEGEEKDEKALEEEFDTAKAMPTVKPGEKELKELKAVSAAGADSAAIAKAIIAYVNSIDEAEVVLVAPLKVHVSSLVNYKAVKEALKGDAKAAKYFTGYYGAEPSESPAVRVKTILNKIGTLFPGKTAEERLVSIEKDVATTGNFTVEGLSQKVEELLSLATKEGAADNISSLETLWVSLEQYKASMTKFDKNAKTTVAVFNAWLGRNQAAEVQAVVAQYNLISEEAIKSEPGTIKQLVIYLADGTKYATFLAGIQQEGHKAHIKDNSPVYGAKSPEAIAELRLEGLAQNLIEEKDGTKYQSLIDEYEDSLPESEKITAALIGEQVASNTGLVKVLTKELMANTKRKDKINAVWQLGNLKIKDRAAARVLRVELAKYVKKASSEMVFECTSKVLTLPTKEIFENFFKEGGEYLNHVEEIKTRDSWSLFKPEYETLFGLGTFKEDLSADITNGNSAALIAALTAQSTYNIAAAHQKTTNAKAQINAGFGFAMWFTQKFIAMHEATNLAGITNAITSIENKAANAENISATSQTVNDKGEYALTGGSNITYGNTVPYIRIRMELDQALKKLKELTTT